MMSNAGYSIQAFVEDAKAIMTEPGTVADKQDAVGHQLSELSRRDDLTRFGYPFGPTDASTANYLLWREPPFTALVLGQFDPGYLSPVHEHGAAWVTACGYAGEDRWDIYERLDDRSRPGFSDVRLVDQWALPPGRFVSMPSPPRAIHAHNNVTSQVTLELIFSYVEPLPQQDRLVYDVESGRCWPSPFNLGGALVGDRYPPFPPDDDDRDLAEPSARARSVGWSLSGAARKWRTRSLRQAWCPSCAASWA